uniref:Uncharacterized protein n=1 Tax=Compsopogon caeruleus TaxID=31354 RepID=A0A6T6CA08_9RHOD
MSILRNKAKLPREFGQESNHGTLRFPAPLFPLDLFSLEPRVVTGTSSSKGREGISLASSKQISTWTAGVPGRDVQRSSFLFHVQFPPKQRASTGVLRTISDKIRSEIL